MILRYAIGPSPEVKPATSRLVDQLKVIKFIINYIHSISFEFSQTFYVFCLCDSFHSPGLIS